MRIIFAASATALLASAPVSAQTAPAPTTAAPSAAAPAVAPPPAAKPKMICKTEEFVGSRIPRRICMSQADWDLGRTKAREIMDERQMWKNTIGKGGN